MGCVNVLFNTDYFDKKKNRFKVFNEIFTKDTENDTSQFIYYKHALFENLDNSNASTGSNDFVFAKIKDGYQKVSKISEGVQADCAVLMLSYDFNEAESLPENLLSYHILW